MTTSPAGPPILGGHSDFEDTPGHPAGDGLIKDFYDDRLANSDLAPLKKQTWSSYNIFAFWMSDVHSVGGYVTAGALFSLGIASWQVLVVPGRRHLHRDGVLQPGGEAEPGDRGALPGDQPGHLRGEGRQHPGHHPGLHRHRLVRRADLPGRHLADDHLLEVHPVERGPDHRRVPRSVAAGLHLLRDPVGRPGRRLLARHGSDPQVHRLRRPRRLRGDDRPVRLPGGPGRRPRQHQPQPEHGAAQLRRVDPDHDRRHRDRGVLLLRADAELRRLLPLREELQGRPQGQLARACR